MKINYEQWEAVLNQSYEVEFDWVGMNHLNQVAIFSSVNKGYIPILVKSSFKTYNQLFAIIDSLPCITTATLVAKEGGIFDDWVKYAEKGLYAFDYQDHHRTRKFDQYDLIAKPAVSLTVNQIKDIESFYGIIPKFNLDFWKQCQFSATL